MIVTVPADTPVTTPDEEPTVAVEPLALVHVPPVEASLSVVVRPTHAFKVPVMGNKGPTVIACVT